MHGLHLEPAGSPAAGVVRDLEGLHHHPLVAPIQRGLQEGRGLLRIPGHQPAHAQLLWDDLRQRLVPRPRRCVDQVLAVAVQEVEEVRGDRQLVAQPLDGEPGGDAARGLLEGPGPAVGAQREHLAVEHESRRGQCPDRGDDLGQAGGDVVEGAGEQAHLAPVAVRLEPDPVELLLDHGPAEAADGLVEALRRRSEHRVHGAAHLEPEVGEPLGALGQRGRGHGAEVAPQHQRPAYVGGRQTGGPRHRLDEDPLQGALPQLAADQCGQIALLLLRRPPEQAVEQLPSRPLGTGTADHRDASEDLVHLPDGEGRLGRGRRQRTQRRPAHPDAALAQLTGEEGHHGRHHRGLRPAQRRSEQLDLARARPSGSHLAGGAGELDERKHPFILTGGPGPGWQAG